MDSSLIKFADRVVTIHQRFLASFHSRKPPNAPSQFKSGFWKIRPRLWHCILRHNKTSFSRNTIYGSPCARIIGFKLKPNETVFSTEIDSSIRQRKFSCTRPATYPSSNQIRAHRWHIMHTYGLRFWHSNPDALLRFTHSSTFRQPNAIDMQSKSWR